MTAAAIAHYLLEFDAADDPKAIRAGGAGPGKAFAASKTAAVDAAFAAGAESGRLAAEARLADRLAEQTALHAKELATAREAWALQEGARLAAQLADGLKEIEARLADTAARLLKPFITAELHGRAMADLVESLNILLARESAATVSISGAPDILEAVRARLGGASANVSYHPGQSSDVRVTVGQTLIETRLGAWMARIEEAVT